MRLGMNRRVRIRIFPAHTRPFFQSLNKWLVLILVIISIVFCYNLFLAYVRPIIEEVALEKAHMFANMAIHQAVADRFSDAGITYNDLITVEKASDGTITAILSNITEINRLKSALAIDIQKRLASVDVRDAGIPLGALLKNDFLAGWGPKIPVRMFQTGYAEVDFKNSFVSAGINQTRHEVSIEVKVDIGMVFPAGRKGTQVVSNVPVAQALIVGSVPDGYVSIEGMTGLFNKALNTPN